MPVLMTHTRSPRFDACLLSPLPSHVALPHIGRDSRFDRPTSMLGCELKMRLGKRICSTHDPGASKNHSHKSIVTQAS